MLATAVARINLKYKHEMKNMKLKKTSKIKVHIQIVLMSVTQDYVDKVGHDLSVF